jgi:hydroxyacyl-ACP dehydratase HTD2-like protein with hotdog domain
MLRVVSAHIHQGATVKSMVYRNHAPLYVDEEMTICLRKLEAERRWDVWIEGAGGGLAVKGTVIIDGR